MIEHFDSGLGVQVQGPGLTIHPWQYALQEKRARKGNGSVEMENGIHACNSCCSGDFL